MTIHQLAKKHNVSDKAIIALLVKLKNNSRQFLDPSTSISLKDAQIISKHFQKKDLKPSTTKSTETTILNPKNDLILLKKVKPTNTIKKENITPTAPKKINPIKIIKKKVIIKRRKVSPVKANTPSPGVNKNKTPVPIIISNKQSSKPPNKELKQPSTTVAKKPYTPANKKNIVSKHRTAPMAKKRPPMKQGDWKKKKHYQSLRSRMYSKSHTLNHPKKKKVPTATLR